MSRFFGVNSPRLLSVAERRRQLLTSIVIALPVCIAFSYFNYLQGFPALALVEVSASALLLLAAWLQSLHDELVGPAEWLGLLWGGTVTVALVVYGGIEGTGVLWIFALPFFAFFLTGQRIGWIVSAGWMAICLLMRLLAPAITDSWAYSNEFTLHLIGAMLWATCIAAAFNLVRERFMFLMVDARKRAEAANTSKSKFLAAVSHDLRQPLMASGLFLDALAHTALSDDQKRYVGHLESATKSMSEMLNTLLTMAKLDSDAITVNLAALPARELFAWVDAEFASVFMARQLRFKLYFLAREIVLQTDIDLLKSLMRNVLGNSLKYCERGGVLVGIRRRGGDAVIQVWDTGIGIDARHIEHIFDEYYQVDNEERGGDKGIGLGLSIVRRQARLIGAEVACRSRLAKGSLFEVVLPLADSAATPADDKK